MTSNMVTAELVSLLTYLFPGLLAAATFYWLTSHPKPDTFERIVQALIFTVLARLLAELVPDRLDASLPSLVDNWQTAISAIIAILLAICLTIIANNDILHRRLRFLRITKETSHPSEWYSAFARKDPRYVVLHLEDGRRLFGWPEEWPSRSDQGHFRLADPRWLNEKNKPIESTVVDMLIPADHVRMVEFLPKHDSDTGE